MKKKTMYLIGTILSIIMSIFGTGLFVYHYPCSKINGILLFIYSFTTACVAVLFYDQYITEKRYEKHRF
jgi:TM2 domain-containing membrane protein YozV